VSAAAELLCAGGFEAVRHRAVARRAGLPLASTTYYFSSLDDLIAAAVEYIVMREAAELRTRVAALSRRRRGAESTSDVLIELLIDDDGPESQAHEQLISRYERYIACARHPALREIQRRMMEQRAEAVAEAVQRSGRAMRTELISTLLFAVDGAVVSSLVDASGTPRAKARATLVEVIDALAPYDRRPAKV
jgi:DNA-binding transcriptional regulator YbjK